MTTQREKDARAAAIAAWDAFLPVRDARDAALNAHDANRSDDNAKALRAALRAADAALDTVDDANAALDAALDAAWDEAHASVGLEG